MIPFVRDFPFAYGHADRLTPLIERVIADNPGPFTFKGTGTYIVGRDEPGASVAVIDPGPLDEGHLQALLRTVDGRVVSHVLVTHTHRDHAPLARPFAEATGARVLAMRSPVRETHASGGADEDEAPAFVPDEVLVGGEVIEGDGWTLEAMATPGHASNHMAFVLREENALFCGDHVMGWATTVVAPPDGDMADYMQSLDAVIARGFSTLYPTHGAPITEPGPFLLAYREHRTRREAQVLKRLAAGDETIEQMLPRLYVGVDKRLWPAAALSVLAHLVKLCREGRVTADPAPVAEARFRLG
ncbi:MBL fold metallo-hydrolase [Brevundimonas sp. PAMC22021]|uniref:MBL fold metallo-hydrolase n=1 Tax=Brevundimonas sp. PAMC22021 TaxID=2861285 RepID=UPI001C6396A8|nr:MBL fold metallo-hydrolase [Brevundimonas sp. PAMC22021]QYF87693.1 MBL fold metallo-hydrolase [Brevundimonas sp. PAMC22021]